MFFLKFVDHRRNFKQYKGFSRHLLISDLENMSNSVRVSKYQNLSTRLFLIKSLKHCILFTAPRTTELQNSGLPLKTVKVNLEVICICLKNYPR